MKIRNASAVLSVALAAAMTVGSVPITAFAVTGSQVAADGTKTANATVTTDSEEDWSSYDISVSLTVADGKISDIQVTPGTGYNDGKDKSYFERATTRTNGIVTKLVGQPATADTINGWDSVSSATHTSDAVKSAALNAIGQFDEKKEETTADKTALNAAVTAADALKESDYTSDTWSTFEAALAAAKTVQSNESATQDEVDQAAKALTDAQAALKNAETPAAVDKTALNEAVTAADALKESDYTADTWSAFATALAAAKTVQSNESATQEEVDKAVEDLTTAQKALAEAEQTQEIYVLMNIPYSEFYSLVGAGSVDVTSAATTKVRINDRAAGSYNGGGSVQSDDTSKGVQSKGVQFPVKVSAALLEDSKYTEVTDSTSYDISYIAHGKSASETVTGKDAMIQADDYAYYKLSETPANYVELTSDGFSAVQGDVQKADTSSVDISYGTRWGTYEVDLPSSDIPAGAVVVKTDKLTFGLKPTQHFWKYHELAWTPTDGLEATNGATLESVTVYSTNGVFEYTLNKKLEKELYDETVDATLLGETGTIGDLPEDIQNAKVTVSYTEGSGHGAITNYVVQNADINLTDGSFTLPSDKLEIGKEYTVSVSSDNYVDISATATYNDTLYVIMNIPYAEFYKLVEAGDVDVTSSATAKVRNSGVAGATYNGGGDATNTTDVTDVTKGVQFAVKVTDAKLLEDSKYTQVTYKTSYNIAYSGRGRTTNTTVKGKDALIQAGDYAYYQIGEVPANYVELTADGFSDIKGDVTAVDGTKSEITYASHWGTYQLDLDGISGKVAGVKVTTDKLTFGLKPTDHIWRSMEIAWDPEGELAATNGATLQSLTVYTDEGVYEITINQKLKNYYTSDITASLSDEGGKVTGLPSDIADAKVTVSRTEGSGRSAVTTKLIDSANISKSGSFTVPANVTFATGKEYTVTVSSSNYVDMSATVQIQFSDVLDQEHPYYNAIYWAANKGVTTGFEDGTFKPFDNVTRGQVVTFLWRLAGSPDPSDGTKAEFSDMVATDHPYYKAILWAVEKGITTGFGDGTFRPFDNCSRGQIVTFIYRYAEEPSVDGMTVSFTDMVAQGHPFYNAITWASNNSITTGFDDGTFGPARFATRGQVVTFLYRYANK